MENIDAGFATVVILILIAGAGVAWVILRTGRTVDAVPAAIIEEGVTDLKLEAWSPTRGFYFFRADSLGPEYLKLPNVTVQHVIKQFGDDVDDARLRLHRDMIAKALKAKLSLDLAVITAEPIDFKPLLRRKGQL